MSDKEGNVYKSSASNLREQIEKDLAVHAEKFKDPVVLGELVYRLLEEKENTNRILKTLLQRIEQLEIKLGEKPAEKEKTNEILLPSTDEKIVQLIEKSGKATAEDVRKALNYKGKNAASARLNRLCKMNILKKQQVGRKVYFLPA
ncbi:hypothetical protein JXB01_00840 [Candidatus Micrarchaeota archaeon]|nr:hypothetical protein [Candidatus Micrarchaeota archaeon]